MMDKNAITGVIVRVVNNDPPSALSAFPAGDNIIVAPGPPPPFSAPSALSAGDNIIVAPPRGGAGANVEST